MKLLSNITRRASFLFLLGFGLLSGESATAVEDCPQELIFQSVPPQMAYPSMEQAREFGLRGSAYSHISIEGFVEFEAIVTERGDITDMRIVESVGTEWGTGQRRYPEGHFNGFFDKTVQIFASKWNLGPIERPCRLRYISRFNIK